MEMTESTAEQIAKRIAQDIHGRAGIGDELDACDAETQDEMMAGWKVIIAEELDQLRERQAGPIGWILRSGHGTQFSENKPEAFVDAWRPVYDHPPASREGEGPVATLRVEKAKNGRLVNYLDGEWQKTRPVGEYPLYLAPQPAASPLRADYAAPQGSNGRGNGYACEADQSPSVPVGAAPDLRAGTLGGQHMVVSNPAPDAAAPAVPSPSQQFTISATDRFQAPDLRAGLLAAAEICEKLFLTGVPSADGPHGIRGADADDCVVAIRAKADEAAGDLRRVEMVERVVDGERKFVDEAPAPAAAMVSETSYVQPVPDHCDRITWRGRYYALPLKDPERGEG